MEEGRHPGLLTKDVAKKVRFADQVGESIWTGPVKSNAAFGNKGPINKS